jgi:uncharacterized phage protein gp47/JayE
MANIPTPRSRNQIFNDMLSAFLSKYGISQLKVGSPILSFLEAAAQSDARSTQDIFNLLDSLSIDRANGQALDRLAADENLTRKTVSAATGLVNFTDGSFTKISTNLYIGGGALVAGSLTVNVTDASLFPVSGNIYIGRGTDNFEGPMAYTAKTALSGYWTLTLSVATSKFHDLGETIVLAQGGVRQIPLGTIVQTTQQALGDSIKFSTLYTAVIPDGEISVSNIEVIASTPGLTGNVAAGSIKQISSTPFPGVTVTNPLPFSNASGAETDDNFRERLRDARQSRTKGTGLSITSSILGATSVQDNKTLVSSSLVTLSDRAKLYIDDGTGYEETIGAVSTETLMDSATGGEQIFQLAGPRPIAKAFVKSGYSAPFVLSNLSSLSVLVGGVTSTHIFAASDFYSIGNASAFEVVSSINGNPNLLFNARTSDGGSKVSLFAKQDINEDIQVLSLTASDANTAFNFSTNPAYTLRLYKNDVLLYKDGKTALVPSNYQYAWNSGIADGDGLTIKVDGTSLQTIVVNNSDFTSLNTGYTTVGYQNSLASWATVLSSKIAGVTVYARNGRLEIVSNLTGNSRSKIEIVGGTLTSKTMFVAGAVSTGLNNDFTLNRNTGQIKLNNPLVQFDNLVVASPNTKAYLQTPAFASSIATGLVGTAKWWFTIDGSATLLSPNISTSTGVTVTNPAAGLARYTVASGLIGTKLQKGDWAIIWDPAFNAANTGVFRITEVVTGDYFTVENAAVVAEGPILPSSQGLGFVRSTTQPQVVTVVAGSAPSLTSLATSFNTQLVGGLAEVYRTKYFRVSSNSYLSGDITLVTANTVAQNLQLPISSDVFSPNHLAIIESGNSEAGTPRFLMTSVIAGSTSNTVNFSPKTASIVDFYANYFNTGNILQFQKTLNGANNKYGNASEDRRVLTDITSGVATTETNARTRTPEVGDLIQGLNTFVLGAEDGINVILDSDPLNKNYNIPLFRKITPLAGAAYGATAFEVRENGTGASLFTNWGTTSLFNDFALYMKARGKSHSLTTNQTLLWRFGRAGPEGEWAKVRYVNPTAPNQAISVTSGNPYAFTQNQISGTGTSSYAKASIDVTLPSGTERTGLGLDGSQYWLVTQIPTYSVIAGLVNSVGTTVTVSFVPSTLTYLHNLSIGDNITLLNNDTSGTTRFISGTYTITGTTSSSFTYTSTNTFTGSSNVTLNYALLYVDTGSSYTVTNIQVTSNVVTATIGSHPFSIGDIVYIPYFYTYNVGANSTGLGAVALTAVTGTTVSWAKTTPDLVSTAVSTLLKVSTGAAYKTTVQQYRTPVAIGSLSKTGTTVTATWAQTALINSCPYQVGDVVYCTPGETNFTAGAKIITSIGAGTFTYTEPAGGTVSTLVQYFQSTASSPALTGGATPVVSGDIVNFSTFVPTNLLGSVKLTSPTSTGFTFLAEISRNYAGSNIFKLGSITNMRFFPVTATAASTIASTVNALTDIVQATVVNGTGAATIGTATLDEWLYKTNNATLNGNIGTPACLPYFDLFDGINFVKNTVISNVASNISLKNAVSGELTANADFNNEVMNLIPKTATNFVSFLSNPASSGISANTSILPSTDGGKIEILSSTSGSSANIQVTGGNGNASSALVFGGATDLGFSLGQGFVFNALTSQLAGFAGRMPIKIVNQNRTTKTLGLTGATTVAVSAGSNANEWLITFSGNVITPRAESVDGLTSRSWEVIKQGNFCGYVETTGSKLDYSSARPGDLLIIENPSGVGFSQVNVGTFNVVGVDSANSTVWVYNPNGVQEQVSGTLAWFRVATYDSVDVGDTFTVGSNVLGTANNGTFTVSRRVKGNGIGYINTFYVTGSMSPIAATALGTNYIYTKVTEANPFFAYSIINSIIKDPVLTGYSRVYGASNMGLTGYISKINSSVNSTIYAVDKLAFPSSSKAGLDGYSYNNGLLGEVHKIVYGDENDPANYPGVACTPALIDISGPLIKRIQVSLELRLRTGVATDTVLSKVRSSIAGTINSYPVGQSIAISDIVNAASKVGGVMSVTITYPQYSSGNDLITIQANEKATILDLATDIAISILN